MSNQENRRLNSFAQQGKHAKNSWAECEVPHFTYADYVTLALKNGGAWLSIPIVTSDTSRVRLRTVVSMELSRKRSRSERFIYRVRSRVAPRSIGASHRRNCSACGRSKPGRCSMQWKNGYARRS